jgi:mono/diheme cytochrome c family protein
MIRMRRTVTALGAALGMMCCGSSFAHELPDLSGAELFQHLCASCHGAAARGNGPVAAVLKPKVPDLTRIAARRGGTFPKQRVWQIIEGQERLPAHGLRDMPVWGWELYAYEGEDPVRRARVAQLITSLVDYLESIQRH